MRFVRDVVHSPLMLIAPQDVPLTINDTKTNRSYRLTPSKIKRAQDLAFLESPKQQQPVWSPSQTQNSSSQKLHRSASQPPSSPMLTRRKSPENERITNIEDLRIESSTRSEKQVTSTESSEAAGSQMRSGKAYAARNQKLVTHNKPITKFIGPDGAIRDPRKLLSRDLRPMMHSTSSSDLQYSVSIDSRAVLLPPEQPLLPMFRENYRGRDVSHWLDSAQRPITTTSRADGSLLDLTHLSKTDITFDRSVLHTSPTILHRPASRADMLQLEHRLDDMEFQLEKERPNLTQEQLIQRQREIYDDISQEILRQVTMQCAERGRLMKRVHELYEARVAPMEVVVKQQAAELSTTRTQNATLTSQLNASKEQCANQEENMKLQAQRIEDLLDDKDGLERELASLKNVLKIALVEREFANRDMKKRGDISQEQEKRNVTLLGRLASASEKIFELRGQLEMALKRVTDLERLSEIVR
eukprot:GILJ01018400.1.p1 GENE.GILJ01018400.1~~GILJ01018400.1.p1  ORF type:complete len:472 (-),score=70.13 GILJ01018400.1:405-1820(-)